MIPLYQSDPHDNSVRKNVRGRAVVGVLLGLFHKFCLDFLSSGNLTNQTTVNMGVFGRANWPYFFCPVKTLYVVFGLSLALARSIRLRIALRK